MSDLMKFFVKNNVERGYYTVKWSNYFELYEKHFSVFRGKKVNVLEIGIMFGGSLCMWADYFGPQATIFGIDINKTNKTFKENIKPFVCNQADREALRDLFNSEFKSLNVVIDDGSHKGLDQIASFEVLFPLLEEGGVYLCEDLHSGRSGEMIEYCVEIARSLQTTGKCGAFGVHFYQGIVVFDKKATLIPGRVTSGRP